MEDFLQEKPRKSKRPAVLFRGYRRVFLLVFAVAVLWQSVSFLQIQLERYHRTLREDFKVILSLSRPADNAQLAAWGESLSAKEDITTVKLFSPQDALGVIKAKNPRLVQELVALGREQMPAYFEIQLTDRALNNIQAFTDNLSAEYPPLLVRYSALQAQWVFYSGLCLRTVNMSVILAFVLFFLFMFMVEAYPTRGTSHAGGAVMSGLLATILSLGFFMLITYPTGYLETALKQFTSVERQAALAVFCGLFGWTLSKWKKF